MSIVLVCMQSIYIDILKIKDYNFPITLETNKHYKREIADD